MKLNDNYERSLVVAFSTWFIKKHDLKLDDENTARLAAEFAAELCQQVENGIGIEAPDPDDIERWVRQEVRDLLVEGDWDQLGRPL
jgi:hypothetical protein